VEELHVAARCHRVDEHKVLSVGIATYQGLHSTHWNLLMRILMMLAPV